MIRWALLLTVLLASPLYAANTLLSWSYPRVKGATSFVIQVRASDQADPTTMTVPASSVGACGKSPDDYCAMVGCFPKIALIFLVKAVTPSGESGFSQPAPCTVCACGNGSVAQETVLTPFATDAAPTETTTTPEYVPIVVEQPPEAPVWYDELVPPPLPAKEGTLPALSASDDPLPLLR